MLKDLLVADIMTYRPITVTPAATLKEAVRLMIQGGFRRLPVVDEVGRLIGIVTDRDIRLATDSPVVPHEWGEHQHHMTHVTVESCMTAEPITVGPATPVADAIRLMRDHRISGLPVVMRDELVGIVTVIDILNAFLEFLDK
jgi:CBS domain-containing protein